MLDVPIDLILQRSGSARAATCRAFSGIGCLQPAFILVEPIPEPAADSLADDLTDGLLRALAAAAPALAEVTPPCGNSPDLLGCRASSQGFFQRLLIVVGDGKTPIPPSPAIQEWSRRMASDPQHRILIVLPPLAPGAKVEQLLASLPRQARQLNSPPYSKPEDVIPDILVLTRISSAFRIFISYRRQDSEGFAKELADRLSHHRFDVFLDQFRIDPGVDFQAKLTEDLVRRSMVLVLESENLLRSKWTRYEINFAKRFRLGLLALQFPSGVAVSGIDPSARVPVSSPDPNAIPEAEWGRIIQSIRQEHGAARIRRRNHLAAAMQQALALAGAGPANRAASGLLEIETRTASGGRQAYEILLSPLPPDLAEFHLTSTAQNRPGASCAIIGNVRFDLHERRRQLQWLCGKSQITLFDEGKMLALAREIAAGNRL
jgi:hypothetical protein